MNHVTASKCGQPNDDKMVMCETEKCCENLWYHYACIGIESEDELPEGAWICSSCVVGSGEDKGKFSSNLDVM